MNKLNEKNKQKLSVEVKRGKSYEDRKELQQSILRLTEQKVEAKFSDKNLDRQNEIIKLRNGSEISLKSLSDIIAKNAQEYSVTFKREWYREINRLNGWNIPEERLHKKPPIVSVYTIELIYGRFWKEVLPELRSLNPYIGFAMRGYKHFQFLTPEGKLYLEKYIDDSLDIMKTCNKWHEFRVKYGNKFGIPFQFSLFEQNTY